MELYCNSVFNLLKFWLQKLKQLVQCLLLFKAPEPWVALQMLNLGIFLLYCLTHVYDLLLFLSLLIIFFSFTTFFKQRISTNRGILINTVLGCPSSHQGDRLYVRCCVLLDALQKWIISCSFILCQSLFYHEENLLEFYS